MSVECDKWWDRSGYKWQSYLQFTVKKSYKAWNKEISVSKLSLNFVEGRRQYGVSRLWIGICFDVVFFPQFQKEKKSKRWDWNDIKRGNLPAIFGKRKRKIWVISDRFYVLKEILWMKTYKRTDKLLYCW